LTTRTRLASHIRKNTSSKMARSILLVLAALVASSSALVTPTKLAASKVVRAPVNTMPAPSPAVMGKALAASTVASVVAPAFAGDVTMNEEGVMLALGGALVSTVVAFATGFATGYGSREGEMLL